MLSVRCVLCYHACRPLPFHREQRHIVLRKRITALNYRKQTYTSNDPFAFHLELTKRLELKSFKEYLPPYCKHDIYSTRNSWFCLQEDREHLGDLKAWIFCKCLSDQITDNTKHIPRAYPYNGQFHPPDALKYVFQNLAVSQYIISFVRRVLADTTLLVE